MVLQWPEEATNNVAELHAKNTADVDYVLFTVSNPKSPTPTMVLHSKGKGGRDKIADILSSSECDEKVLTGAFLASGIDERGDVVSIRRKLIHVTYVGGRVGVMTKGKVNAWSGSFRDPFPNVSIYLQLDADRMDELDENTLEMSLIASSGGDKPSRIDFSNGDENKTTTVYTHVVAAPDETTKQEDEVEVEKDHTDEHDKQRESEIEDGQTTLENKELASHEPESFQDRMKAFRESTSAKKKQNYSNKVVSDEFASCQLARESAKGRWGKTKQDKDQEKMKTAEPEPESVEACLSPSKLKNSSWIKKDATKVAQNPVAPDDLAQCREAKERVKGRGSIGSFSPDTPEQNTTTTTTTTPSDMPTLEKNMLKDRMSVFGGGKEMVATPKKDAKSKVANNSPPSKQPQGLSTILQGIWPEDVSTTVNELQAEQTNVDYILYAVSDLKKTQPELTLHSKGKGGRAAIVGILAHSECNDKVITGAFMVSAVDERGDVVSIRRKFIHVTYVGESVGALAKGKVNAWSGSLRDPFPNISIYLQLNADRMDELDENTLEESLIAGSGGDKPSRIDFSNGGRMESKGDRISAFKKVSTAEYASSKIDVVSSAGPSLKDRVSALKEASSPDAYYAKKKLIDPNEEIMGSPGAASLISVFKEASVEEKGLPPPPLTMDEMMEIKPIKVNVVESKINKAKEDTTVTTITIEQ